MQSPVSAQPFAQAFDAACTRLEALLGVPLAEVVLGEGADARADQTLYAQPGLFAYAVVALVTRGAPFAYINPANGSTFAEPIALWSKFFGAGAAPIDPIRLYVGNVPGPVFATSLMAVAVGVTLMSWITVEMVMFAGLTSLLWAFYLVLGTVIATVGAAWWRFNSARNGRP